jgi:hypothetical protein
VQAGIGKKAGKKKIMEFLEILTILFKGWQLINGFIAREQQ